MSAPPPAAPRPEDVLFVGDVHLGRRPTGLDAALELLADGGGLRPRELSPAAALGRLVDLALASPPRAVVFAGDLVDRDDDRFEAYHVLETQVKRLRDADIPVLAVAGNHDHLVLPRLVERVAGVELVGAGGRWEHRSLPGPADAPMDLVGWSFPERVVHESPLDHPGLEQALAAAEAGRARGTRCLAVLHADLDASRSPYAPVSRRRLEALPVDGCFLGHVHKPHDLTGARPLGYLGSLVGLDIGEPGPRGPWLVGPAEGGGLAARQVCLGPVRFATWELALEPEDAADEDRLHERLQAEATERLEADPSFEPDRHHLVVARWSLTGELADRTGLAALAARCRREPVLLHAGGVPVLAERLLDRTREQVDLEQLATDPSPLGHLARVLLELGAGDPVPASAEATVARVADQGWRLDDEDHPLPPTAELLERAAWATLRQLLAQRRTGGVA